MKTNKGKQVVEGKLYNLKYKWGDGFIYGIGWINPKRKNSCVDILCNEGGVTYQDEFNVVFIDQIKQ